MPEFTTIAKIAQAIAKIDVNSKRIAFPIDKIAQNAV